MIVSFSGNDGVGKSSLVEATYRLLRQNKMKCSINSEYNFGLVKLGKILCGEALFHQYNRRYMSHEPGVSTPRLLRFAVRMLYPINIFAHFLLRYIWFEIFFKRRVLICDRYLYDYRLTLSRQEINFKLLDVLFLKFPKPTVAFVIDVPPSTILKRLIKAERQRYDLEFYEFLAERYRDLARVLKLPCVQNLDFDATFETVKKTLENSWIQK